MSEKKIIAKELKTPFFAQCNQCGGIHKNKAGSSLCCGSIMYIVKGFEFELISVRQYAYENGITKPGVIKQIEENRLPENIEARKVDSSWIMIKYKEEPKAYEI